jgi:hypothetical protein
MKFAQNLISEHNSAPDLAHYRIITKYLARLSYQQADWDVICSYHDPNKRMIFPHKNLSKSRSITGIVWVWSGFGLALVWLWSGFDPNELALN